MHGKTVILVEDDDDLREILVERLRPAYVTISFADPESAWEALRRGLKADLVITDLYFYGSHGYQFIANLRTDPMLSGLPVIVLSGDPNVEAFGAITGIAAYSKDICENADNLRLAVRAALEPSA